MMQTLTHQTKEYQLDVSKTDRAGAFLCPNCKTKISPDDCSEDVYDIYETKTAHGNLEELVIHCKRCRSIIHLRGFSIIPQTGDIPKRKPTEITRSLHLVAPHIHHPRKRCAAGD